MQDREHKNERERHGRGKRERKQREEKKKEKLRQKYEMENVFMQTFDYYTSTIRTIANRTNEITVALYFAYDFLLNANVTWTDDFTIRLDRLLSHFFHFLGFRHSKKAIIFAHFSYFLLITVISPKKTFEGSIAIPPKATKYEVYDGVFCWPNLLRR